MRLSTLNRLSLLVSLTLLFVLFTGPVSLSQRRPTPQPATQTSQRAKRPRLVLLIAIDQFRYDYLERFGDLFGQNGLRRLMRDGASWTQSDYDHFPTYTGPGHGMMMTGAYPAESGIVGNEWIERSTAKRVTSVSDATVKALGGAES